LSNHKWTQVEIRAIRDKNSCHKIMSVVIKVENLSKQYRLGNVGAGSLAHDVNRSWHHRMRGKEDPYLMIGEENDRSVKEKSCIS